VQKFRTAVAIQRQRHKVFFATRRNELTHKIRATDTEKSRGTRGEKKGKRKQAKGVVTRGLQASSDPAPHPVKQQRQQEQQKRMFFFPQENLKNGRKIMGKIAARKLVATRFPP
jgi:hypothetical protein